MKVSAFDKKFYRISLNFRKLLQCFFGNFPATLGNIWSRVIFKYIYRPFWKFSTKLLRASILQSESASVCSVKKDLHSWRYLRNFSEFQKCARLKSAVSGMQFTKKELHRRLQSRHLRKLFGVNVANCRFLEISRRTTFWNTPVQVIEFLIDLYNVEISPITLLKSDSAREALLVIFQNRKTQKKYFQWSQFSV